MKYPLSVETTAISDLTVLHREPFSDHRGLLDRLFDFEATKDLVSDFSVAQVNHTVTQGRGTVRGLHFQFPPFADAKFITCLRGRVFDVAVDLRQGSPTFLDWYGIELVEADAKSVLVPQGFAHGFQLLADKCELLYVHSEHYHQEAEGGIHAEDPLLDIRWPEPILTMSTRDRGLPTVEQDWPGVEV